MKLIKMAIAPFKNKIKLQQKVNTLEIKKEELEIILHSRISETLMRTLENQQEVERLRKENTRLRNKIKEIKKGDK